MHRDVSGHVSGYRLLHCPTSCGGSKVERDDSAGRPSSMRSMNESRTSRASHIERLVRRAHITRHVSLRVPASRPFFGPPIWSSGGSRHWSTSPHSPHAQPSAGRARIRRELQQMLHHDSCWRCFLHPQAARAELGQLGPLPSDQNPPLGLKFSQVQRTIRSYVVQSRAQAKLVFPTCVRVLPT